MREHDPQVILLVEDSRIDEKLTVREFRRHGITNEIVVVQSGDEALDYLFSERQFAGVTTLPLVMVLDLKLPMIEGINVLRRVRADLRTKLLPVLVLTGSQDPRDSVQSYALKAKGFLRKPFAFQQFAGHMKRLGLESKLLTRPSANPGGK